MAIQEVGQYLLTRLPPETLRKASARVLAECGYASASRPGMLAEAIQVAMGEVLFLRERFPDLPPRKLLVPWDPDLEFPYAADELARALGIALKEHFGQPGGFASGFLDRTIQILKSLFPPRPRFFAYTALLFGDRESRELFAGLFRDWDRKEFDINDYGRFVSEWEKAPNRPVFMAVTVQNEGNVLKALKRLAEWNQISNALRSAKTGPFVYSVPSKNAGQVFIVRTADLDSMRKALVRLFSMSEVATGSISIK
jgi:hypothetical protein